MVIDSIDLFDDIVCYNQGSGKGRGQVMIVVIRPPQFACKRVGLVVLVFHDGEIGEYWVFKKIKLVEGNSLGASA